MTEAVPKVSPSKPQRRELVLEHGGKTYSHWYDVPEGADEDVLRATKMAELIQHVKGLPNV